MLVEAGLPEYDYIKIENGIYRWDSPMKVRIDVADFLELLQKAEKETEERKKMDFLSRACRLYRGEFLPALSGEDWVIVNSVRYKERYGEAMIQVCEYLKRQREYEQIVELTSTASEIYPFDEWQSLKIDALMCMNHYKRRISFMRKLPGCFLRNLGSALPKK